MPLDSRSRVAIVGAGTMGAGIAQVAAASGHDVIVVDQNAEALERGRATLSASLAAQVRKGRMDVAEQARIESRIHWTDDIVQAATAGLAIEAIIERLDAKRSLFSRLATLLPGDAVLASNTSSLGIADIAAAIAGPARVIGLHFFNPVPQMKLVEIIATPDTGRSVAAAAEALMRVWGKHPILVADVPGFIVNRVARPYYAEAFLAWGEGVPAAAVDHALLAGGGFRMGPLALADMIGQDVNYTVATTVFDAYRGKTRFRPQPAQQALVEAGTLGRKSGTGVYDYANGVPAADLIAPQPVPKIAEVDGHGIMATLCNRAALSVTLRSNGGDGAIVDGVRIMPSDGRALSARSDADVLIDWVRDPDKAQSIALTARDEHAATTASGLIQASGRDALRLPDRPGLVVARTLAQLANAAADAVEDRVAAADDIDMAMTLGANHPEGPLAWARRAGFGTIATLLDNLADATGDTIYRPSTLFTASSGKISPLDE